MSNLWFNKQMLKNKPKKVENIYTKTNTNINTNDEIKEEENIEMNNKKVLTVAVDAGKGYTKYFYRVETKQVRKKDGSIGYKYREEEGIFKSAVLVGKTALAGNTVYIDEVPYDFNGTQKAVELKDIHKNNNEHKALMQKALFEIAKKEKITTFDVIMCTSLDHYKLDSNVEQMQKDMSIGTFKIKDDTEELEITIENVVIEPETLVSTRFADTKLPDVLAILVDIGTLNVGLVPLNMARLNKETITAPMMGYDYMVNNFKEYTAMKGANYSKEMLEMYIDKKQGTVEKLDELFKEFFVDEYSKVLKNKIDEKGFGEFANLVFMGGTSIKCKSLIEEAFKDYENVEVIEDIFATVKGAYRKGVKDLEKIKQI